MSISVLCFVVSAVFTALCADKGWMFLACLSAFAAGTNASNIVRELRLP